jgi:beta-glucosidase/6-phospho-beta-glucosidase/beta-galactosidase
MDIKPESMQNVLDGLRMRYGKIKMMITESGNVEFNAKINRNNFQKEIIDTHFQSVIEYQKKYHTILGYMYWTLMDNYEWEDGYKQNFGLYTMSYKKGKLVCKLKDSGEYYSQLLKTLKK